MLRGKLLADEYGCFGCHRPDSGSEIPNPGSRWGTVPKFQAGNAFMYGDTASEIEEFIRFGAPRAWLDEASVRERLSAQHLRMPEYDDLLSDSEIDDLVRFISALEGIAFADEEIVSEGRELARSHGCTSCHGIAGSGGVANPRSLGGFIPGFTGGNFEHLVADRAEFSEWVRTGRTRRLAGNPIVRAFWRRQSIVMPAYDESLSDQQIDAIWAWVTTLR